MPGVVAAVDLGATSGRVIVGAVEGDRLRMRTAHRFPNTPVETPDGLHWNILELYRNVVEGLGTAVREVPDLAGVAVDAWAVDYALMRAGRMLGTPYHYRDGRTDDAIELVHARVPPSELYARNGLQFLPFNTIYQLTADADVMRWADAMLLVPDLITYWLTGRAGCELTNASTTGLLDVSTRDWDTDLATRLDIPTGILADLVEPGTAVGGLRGNLVDSLGVAGGPTVTVVGSHDTASAVVGTPMTTDDAAYISCGTWGLVGLELERPILSEASRAAGFTNEGGVDGRIRFLHNVMGLWLLSESVRQWQRGGESNDVEQLVREAADVEASVPVFDVDDPRFLAPGDMPARIHDWCAEHDMVGPAGVVETVRSILESLAAAFAASIDRAAQLSGRTVGIVHLVGGGARNALLCQLTADRCGRPVLAGPVEATATGNLLVQARALGLVGGDLETLRAITAAAHPPTRYDPTPTPGSRT